MKLSRSNRKSLRCGNALRQLNEQEIDMKFGIIGAAATTSIMCGLLMAWISNSSFVTAYIHYDEV
jgi:hypothetical protein